MTLARTIAIARHQAGLTQQELAEMAGLSLQHLRFIEQQRRRPSCAVAVRLQTVLGIRLEVDGLRRVRPLRCDCGERHRVRGKCRRCYDKGRREEQARIRQVVAK
jgi:transcriptional regulator with XRE-family HTH domain